jgi:CRP/FNR family transcriptional regulator, cyclic AMP receptor protein
MPSNHHPLHEQLQTIWLFADLTDSEIEAVARIAQRRRCERGKVITRRGEADDADLYCVLKGHLKVTASDADGDEILISLMKSGDSFGHIAFLDRGPRSATVTTLDAVELLVIRRADFDLVLNRSPKIAGALLIAMARQIRRLTERMEDNAFLDVRGRLAKRLLDLAEVIGTPIDANQSVLKIRLSQQELGNMVQATRETVNKCLRDFEREGAIHRGSGRLVILDRRRLRDLSAA